MERILITGVLDVVGAGLAHAWADTAEVLGTLDSGIAHRAARGSADVSAVTEFDATSVQAWRDVIRELRPDRVVHSGALAGSSWDEVDAASLAREVEVAAALTTAFDAESIPLTVIVSDAVFAGPTMFHPEDAPRFATGPLAEASRAAEDQLRQVPSLIVRSHVYGSSPAANSASFIDRTCQKLQAGEAVEVDTYRYATPIFVGDFAELLREAHLQGLTGILHLAGAERTCPARMVRELVSQLGACARLVDDGHAAARRPVPETSLLTRLARTRLGRPMPLLSEGLARFVASLEAETKTETTSRYDMQRAA